MVFREVSVIEIREVLRSWLAGAGLRTVAAQAGADRKTARRHAGAAVAAGLARDGGTGQLPGEGPASRRPDGRGSRRADLCHRQSWHVRAIARARVVLEPGRGRDHGHAHPDAVA